MRTRRRRRWRRSRKKCSLSYPVNRKLGISHSVFMKKVNI
jgi:hypothetical protein